MIIHVCEHEIVKLSPPYKSCLQNMFVNMICTHGVIFGEHKKVMFGNVFVKHGYWKLARSPRPAVQARVPHCVSDVFVSAVRPQLDFASDVDMQVFWKLALAYVVLSPIVPEAFSEGADIRLRFCCSLIHTQRRNVGGGGWLAQTREPRLDLVLGFQANGKILVIFWISGTMVLPGAVCSILYQSLAIPLNRHKGRTCVPIACIRLCMFANINQNV